MSIAKTLAWSIALSTQELYRWLHVLKEKWREDRTSSSSLNFFQAVFKGVVAESSQPQALRACLLGSKRKLPPPACQVRRMWSAIQGQSYSLALSTSVNRVFCQVLEPTAFLVHPVLAATAEDAVAAHFSATDCAWKLCLETGLNSAGSPGLYIRAQLFKASLA